MRLPLSMSILIVASFSTLPAGTAAGQWYQGPSGSAVGQRIDDWVANGKATNIRGVHVYLAADGSIKCVRTYYPSKSNPNDPISSESANVGTPGCNGGAASKVLQFRLDPDEYILGISGTYTNRINTLRFYSNKRNSQVYGAASAGMNFGYTAPSGQMIVAFTGSGDTFLRSIGVMYAPCTPATKICK